MFKRLAHIDWILFFATIPLLGAGLITMSSFTGADNYFSRQLTWIVASIIIFFVLSMLDLRFLKKTEVITFVFGSVCSVLLLLFVVGTVSKGAQSWFRLGFFSIQPAEVAKLVLILVLSKYFSRRHIEIAHIRHIIVSGFYAFILFFLILMQPDFGSAIIIFMIWLGMVLVSGISKKHLLIVAAIGALSFAALWTFVFADYQKARIISFIHPLADIQGSGYNAYQSTVTIGSGQLFGKGIGYGTQSRLHFLPEYQTDFIFAAFSEEWGFVGSILVLILFGIVIYRILKNTWRGASNFEILYGAGVAILFVTHFFINIGMNMGLLPVTGITVPFMSYGGSHLIVEFAALGILMSMRKYARVTHRDSLQKEFFLSS
jgi:rod shape determining protein RodA